MLVCYSALLMNLYAMVRFCFSVTNSTPSNFTSNLRSRFPVSLSRTTRVLLQSSSHGPQPVTLLPPCLLPLPVSFLPLLPLPFLSPRVPSQQQQPSATSLLTGESRCSHRETITHQQPLLFQS